MGKSKYAEGKSTVIIKNGNRYLGAIKSYLGMVWHAFNCDKVK